MNSVLQESMVKKFLSALSNFNNFVKCMPDVKKKKKSKGTFQRLKMKEELDSREANDC